MLLQNGANAAILDLNADLGQQAASELGSSARFFQCDVTSSESIAGAVKATMEWVTESGKPLGGIVPAAGIATPGTVSLPSLLVMIYWWKEWWLTGGSWDVKGRNGDTMGWDHG